MSRKGKCLDNAPTERFFRSLTYEQFNYETFKPQYAKKRQYAKAALKKQLLNKEQLSDNSSEKLML